MYKDKKDLISIKDLSRGDIEEIFTTSRAFKEVIARSNKKVPALRGRTVINLFYEPSTRTKSSFEIAGKRLSADVINFSASTSALKKGESLLDTARNLEAMMPDILVVRHAHSGAVRYLADRLASSVLNAGDGQNEHPTQALLDAFTLHERCFDFTGKHFAIVGDIVHSRVAKSNIFCLRALGARVTVVAPPTLMPPFVQELPAASRYDLDPLLPEVDVIMMLRVQFERHQGKRFPTIREYASLYGLNRARARKLPDHAVIMHPGPINRGIELDPEVADGPRSVILDQVTHGVALRMALLYLFAGHKAKSAASREEN